MTPDGRLLPANGATMLLYALRQAEERVSEEEIWWNFDRLLKVLLIVGNAESLENCPPSVAFLGRALERAARGEVGSDAGWADPEVRRLDERLFGLIEVHDVTWREVLPEVPAELARVEAVYRDCVEHLSSLRLVG